MRKRIEQMTRERNRLPAQVRLCEPSANTILVWPRKRYAPSQANCAQQLECGIRILIKKYALSIRKLHYKINRKQNAGNKS